MTATSGATSGVSMEALREKYEMVVGLEVRGVWFTVAPTNPPKPEGKAAPT